MLLLLLLLLFKPAGRHQARCFASVPQEPLPRTLRRLLLLSLLLLLLGQLCPMQLVLLR
jgi:hypothetical protein